MNQFAQNPRVGIGVLVLKEGKILMGKRIGSHSSGKWGIPGGHLEFGEAVIDCAKRELLEETGVTATSIELVDFWTENLMDEGAKHYVNLFCIVESYEGEIKLLEPNKCMGWEWFDLDQLPTPLFEPIPIILKKLRIYESH